MLDDSINLVFLLALALCFLALIILGINWVFNKFLLGVGDKMYKKMDKNTLKRRKTWLSIGFPIVILVAIYALLIKPLLEFKAGIDLFFSYSTLFNGISVSLIFIVILIIFYFKSIKQINSYIN